MAVLVWYFISFIGWIFKILTYGIGSSILITSIVIRNLYIWFYWLLGTLIGYIILKILKRKYHGIDLFIKKNKKHIWIFIGILLICTFIFSWII